MRLFLYGTLADPAALGRCAGRPLRLEPIPAMLGGYRRVLLRHARYPTLRRAAGHQVGGIVVRVSADMLVRRRPRPLLPGRRGDPRGLASEA